MSERVQPHSFDAEQAVLGAALQSAHAADEATETLRADDFYDRFHAEIFSAMSELIREKTPIDLVTVQDALKKRGVLEAVGGVRYLADLAAAVPAPSSISHYADIVREHSTRRRLIAASEEIIDKSISGEDDAEVVREFAEREILEIGRMGQKADYASLSDVLTENLAYMERLSKLRKGDLTGLTTGFPALDRMTLGLQPSELIILAARPGMGKTSLALNIALNSAVKADAVVMIFSIEMNKILLGQRLLSTHADIDAMRIRSGEAIRDKEAALKIGEVMQELAKTNIFIDDTSSIQISDIKNKCRRLKLDKNKLDLIIVDYLQLMDFGGSGKTSSRPENRQQEITTLMRMLKQLARDMECPVLVLSQLSREIERRSNHTPILADLRESGAIEQDADIVMFIYQEGDRDDGNGPDINLTRQLYIAKHRNGETGTITLRWLKEFTKFTHYDRDADWLANVGSIDTED